MFEFYRNGEWLTKNRAGYGFNVGASMFSNTMAIQNPSLSSNWFWVIQSLLGSQYTYGQNGDPVVNMSVDPAYSYAHADATGSYNSTSAAATDVSHASRSVLWLKPDFIFVYDRADTNTANRFKRFWLNTQVPANVNGKLAVAKTPNGQSLCVTNVFPSGAVVSSQFDPSSSTGADKGESANYEIMTSRILVEDPSNPTSLRMLNVLQGNDKGVPPSPIAALVSTSGDAFEGVSTAGLVVIFRKNLSALTTTTFTVPGGTSKTYVCGLTPGAAYTVSKTVALTGSVVTISAGGISKADQGGVLSF